MKKKLIISALAMVCALSAFTACNIRGKDSAESSSTGNNVAYDVEGAAAYVKSMYKDNNKSGRSDYEVIKQIVYDDAMYTITWSTNTDAVTIGDNGDRYIVDVEEATWETISFVLTATVTAPDGTTAIVELNRTLEAAPTKVPMAITSDPVVGTEYMLYVFHEQNQTDLYANGNMANTYYFATSSTSEKAITVYVEAATDGFYLYHKVNDTNTYINIVQNGTHTNAVYETTASTVYSYDAELDTMVTNLDGTKFYLGADSTHTTISPYSQTDDTHYQTKLVTMTDRTAATDEDKLAQTVRELSVPAVVVGEYTYALNQQGNTYPDAKITWSLNSNNATLGGYKNHKLTFAATNEVATVSVKATITVNGKTETKDFDIKHIPNTPDEIMTAARALQPGESFANDVTLTGMVTVITTAYDSEYANVTLTIKVGDKSISCRRLVGDGADVLQAGYTITVTGQITNYNGTIQFDQGCELLSYEEGTLPETPDTDMGAIVDEAYQLESGASMSEAKTLTGVVTKIDTAYDSYYKNVTVTIVVADKTDKPIQCFRMKGDDASNVKVGDTITVTGTLTNYNGTIEFGAGCTLDKLVAGTGSDNTDNNSGSGNSGTTDDNSEAIASIDMMGTTNRTSYAADKVTYSANGITYINEKGSYANSLHDQTGTTSARAYKSSTITISSDTAFTKVVFTLDDYSSGQYLTGFDGMEIEGATITRETDVVTITFSSATKTFTTANLLSQVRIEKIEIF